MAKYVGFKIGKVHESHVISEYYCGGCGWPVTDHDSFCPECGGAFRECDADNLEEENAKLLDEIKRRDELEGKLIRCIENDYGIVFAWDPLRKVWLSECTDEYVTERERLKAENDKLWEELEAEHVLAETLGHYHEDAKADNDKLRELVDELYPLADYGAMDASELDRAHDLMRELGVEVS